MTSTDLVYAGASLRERQEYALALSKAGELIPRGLRNPDGTPSAGKILLVTEYGNALGIHPIVAINGIDIIEGALAIKPALMSGLIRENGMKLRIRTDGSGAQLSATATLIRPDDPDHPFDVTWTMADAKAAGLDGKQNWKKYPRAMLKARAISEVCREGAEDILMGAHYTPEELGANTNEAGEVIEDAVIVEDTPPVSTTTPIVSKVEKRARQRDAGETAPETQSTPNPAQGPGRSRPQEAAAGPTIPAEDWHIDGWRNAINDAYNLTSLEAVYKDAKRAHVLNNLMDGRPLGDHIRDKKTRLQQQDVPEPTPPQPADDWADEVLF